jgi:hypothetical protein
LSEYSNDDEGYKRDMVEYVLPELNSLSETSVNYDAMENLLLWMVRRNDSDLIDCFLLSYHHCVASEQLIYASVVVVVVAAAQTWNTAMHPVDNGTIAKDQLVMNGDPRYIFKKTHLVGSFANQYGECDAANVASFDQSSGVVTFHVDYDGFSQSPLCNTTCTLEYMGYDSQADHGHFNTMVDVETVVVAAAVRAQSWNKDLPILFIVFLVYIRCVCCQVFYCLINLCLW